MAKKDQYIDDGHTIYNMDVDGMPHRIKKTNNIGLTKKEKKAAINAAYSIYFKVLIGFIVCFLIAMLIISLWLKP